LYELNQAGFVAFDGSPLNPDELGGAKSEVREYSNILGGEQGDAGLGFKVEAAINEKKDLEEILNTSGKIDGKTTQKLSQTLQNYGVKIDPKSTWGAVGKNSKKQYKIDISKDSSLFGTKLDGKDLTLENLETLLDIINHQGIGDQRIVDDQNKMVHDNIFRNRKRK